MINLGKILQNMTDSKLINYLSIQRELTYQSEKTNHSSSKTG